MNLKYLRANNKWGAIESNIMSNLGWSNLGSGPVPSHFVLLTPKIIFLPKSLKNFRQVGTCQVENFDFIFDLGFSYVILRIHSKKLDFGQGPCKSNI